LNRLLEVFLNNLLPVFLSAGAGLAIGRAFRPDRKTVTQLAFYIFSPCLVFASLTRVEVSGAEFGLLALFTLTVVAGMALLAALAGRLLGADRRTLVTLVIASAFVNSGNFGLAATRFAFGEAALARAIIYYVFSTIAVYTLGVFVASLGNHGPRQAVREILSVPAFYAVLAAGLARGFGWTVPPFVERTVSLLGEAAIPVMLVLLGLQIAAARVHPEAWPRPRLVILAAATVLQLLVAPLTALALASLIGLTGPTWQAAVLETSMPAAVITTVLAVQYDLDAELMTGAVVLTTLLSPLTLTPLIIFLQASG
jgi:predicted permease